MHLDRDDRGNLSDNISLKGEVVSSPINQETVTVRGLQTGEYVINLLHYKSNYQDPLPVTVKVEKLNPSVELIYYGQHFLNGVGDEITALRFSVDGNKEVSNINQLLRDFLPRLLVVNNYARGKTLTDDFLRCCGSSSTDLLLLY
jgi:hypothetical protein